MDLHMELKRVSYIQNEIRFFFVKSTDNHACTLALITLSLYIDSKHRSACCSSARIQTIHFDRHVTIQGACQLCELHAFSDWIC